MRQLIGLHSPNSRNQLFGVGVCRPPHVSDKPHNNKKGAPLHTPYHMSLRHAPVPRRNDVVSLYQQNVLKPGFDFRDTQKNRSTERSILSY